MNINMDNVSQGALMQQAQNIWQMLDEMSESDPDSYRRFINQQMAEGSKAMAPATPHMCLKTRLDTNDITQMTAHVNVFGWQHVPEPKSDESPIPVIGGPLQTNIGNSGSINVAVVALNPVVLEQFGRDSPHPEERKMLICLVLDFLHDQHKMTLSRDYTVLPVSQPYYGDLKELQMSLKHRRFPEKFRKKDTGNGEDLPPSIDSVLEEMGLPADSPLMSQLGSLAMQTASPPVGATSTNSKFHGSFQSGSKANSMDSNAKSSHLIEELGQSKPAQAVVTNFSTGEEIQQSETVQPAIPQYELTDLSSNDCMLKLRVELPEVTSVGECELDISKVDVELRVGDRYHLVVKFPCPVRADDATARFSRRSNTLTVTLPKDS